MVKITEKDPEATLDERCGDMFKIAYQTFKDVKNEWAESHPHNVQKKYDIQMEANHPSGRKPRPGIGFSLMSVKPHNGARRHELLTCVINVYPAQNKVSVNDPKYFDDAVRLAESYERVFTQEFTVEKNYS